MPETPITKNNTSANQTHHSAKTTSTRASTRDELELHLAVIATNKLAIHQYSTHLRQLSFKMCHCIKPCSNKHNEEDSFTDIILVCNICERSSLKDKPKPPNPWPVYIYRICVDCESKAQNGNVTKAQEPVQERKECEGCEIMFYGIGSVTITAERHRTRYWDPFCEECAQWIVDVWHKDAGESDIFYDCQTIPAAGNVKATTLEKRLSTRKSI